MFKLIIELVGFVLCCAGFTLMIMTCIHWAVLELVSKVIW